jgi:D-serine deaminase-like pyridoxal phosphate-dependent protein
MLLIGASSAVAVYKYLSSHEKKSGLSSTDKVEKELIDADQRVHVAPEFRLHLELIGKKIDQVPTPALILELEDYEHNLALLKKTLYEAKCDNVKIRAHFKAHKCPQIAYQQVTFGSCVGLCCQKLSEAVALLESRHLVDDVFISNEIVDESKLKRLVQLALLHPDGNTRHIRLSATVDNEEGINLFLKIR